MYQRHLEYKNSIAKRGARCGFPHRTSIKIFKTAHNAILHYTLPPYSRKEDHLASSTSCENMEKVYKY